MQFFDGVGGGAPHDIHRALRYLGDDASEPSIARVSGPPDSGIELPDAGVALPDAGPEPPDGGTATAPSQNATATEIVDAATSRSTQEQLDIAWIGDESLGMNDHVRDSIDGPYAEKKHEKARRKFVAARLKKFDREHAKTPRTPDLDAMRGDAETQARVDYEASVRSRPPDESVAEVDPKTLEVGRMRRRTNFMALTTHLMKDPNKVKKHFLGIKPTAGNPHMLLAEGARRRFEMAKAKFEEEHPGYTLPTSGVAHSMRDRHEKRMGLGMLGHSLGLSVDFSAYENPNLIGEKSERRGVNAFMLERFGGGRATMDIDERDVERLGKATAARPSRPNGETSTQVVEQFNQIAKTSDNFQKALSPSQMSLLRAARNVYFDNKANADTLSQLRKDIANPKLDPAKRAALASQIETLEPSVAASRHLVDEQLKQSFSPWTGALEAEIGQDVATFSRNQVSAGAYASDRKRFHSMSKEQIDAYAKAHDMRARGDFQKSKAHRSYEVMIKAEIENREKEARERADYAMNSNEVKRALIDKLRDPRRVFGTGVKKDDKSWDTKQEVTEVAVMQLLEHGFVKKDEMDPVIDREPRRGGSVPRGRKAVFNAEAVEMLVRYGFAPGSNFGDTMHFDYIQGYSEAVDGGRSGENMNKLRFSPEGDFIPPEKTRPADKSRRRR